MKKLILYLALIFCSYSLIRFSIIAFSPPLHAKDSSSEKEIADFTRKVTAEKILSDFRKIGNDAKNITILLSTFDSLEAKIGKDKLSDLYRNEAEKLVEKVVEDKISYGLNNEQVRSMVNLNKKFNAFIQKAISVVKTQEKRR